MSLAEITKPFTVINDATSQQVRNKYLEGQPFKNNFPGPFQTLTPQQNEAYLSNQNNAIQNYWNIAEKPLNSQAKKYPSFNQGKPDCANYFDNQIAFVTPPDRERGMGNEPGRESEINHKGIVRMDQEYWDQHGMKTKSVSPGNSNGKTIEGFKDNNLTDPVNETGFGTITPQFLFPSQGKKGGEKCSATGNPLLDIQNRPNSQFSHNNMVPYYGANVTQNMATTGVPQAGDNNTCGENTNGFANATPYRDLLQTFTGTDEMWMHKRETPVMFSPVERLTSWVYGTPAIRPDLDRYKQDLKIKNNESPVEKIRVGPGIATGYSTPATGGFQEFTRILPNNVNNYKANQLEGRVNAGKWVASEHPTSQFIHGVQTNKPNLVYTQARRPTMRGKFQTSAPSAGSARVTEYNTLVNRGRQNRTDTEQSGGFGQLKSLSTGPGNNCIDFSKAPIGMTMKGSVNAPTQDLQSYNTIRETFKKGAAGYSNGKYWECPEETQGANRWDITLGPATGANVQGTREGIYMNYTDRGNKNPYVINATGTAVGANLWNPNSYSQAARTTMKETNNFSYAGNTRGPTTHTVTQYEDDPKVTMKETTMFSHNGAPSKGNAMKNMQQDELRVTTKQTTQYAYQGSAGTGANQALIDRQMYTGKWY